MLCVPAGPSPLDKLFEVPGVPDEDDDVEEKEEIVADLGDGDDEGE